MQRNVRRQRLLIGAEEKEKEGIVVDMGDVDVKTQDEWKKDQERGTIAVEEEEEAAKMDMELELDVDDEILP